MSPNYQITKDDLSAFAGKGPAFVTLGEVMVRDTPAVPERLERAGTVYISLAGSEYTLASRASGSSGRRATSSRTNSLTRVRANTSTHRLTQRTYPTGSTTDVGASSSKICSPSPMW